jgi:hypothetical protein
MAAAGGIVSIYWDVADAIGHFEKKDSSGTRTSKLWAAYSLRAIATGALVIGQGGVAFSQAGLYLEWLALRGNNSPGSLFLRLSSLSNQLAANRALMLLLSRLGWVGGTVALGATTYLLVMNDNALEQWCEKCCFSLKPTAKRYNSDADEMVDFLASVTEVL